MLRFQNLPGLPYFMIFLLLVLGAVWAEIWLLIQVGGLIGAGWTLLLLFASAVFGVRLVRVQGLVTATRVQAMLAQGQSPALGMLEGLALLVAGFLFIVPGFISDVVGFALLIPPLRRGIIRGFFRRALHINPTAAPAPTHNDNRRAGHVPLEGESRRVD
jgi:UPF0716 protein FxsA